MKKISLFLGLPKSLFVNMKLLPFYQAIKLPILVSHKIRCVSLKGRFEISGGVRTGMVTVGLTGAGSLLHKPCVLEVNGKVICDGPVSIGGGCELCCGRNGSIILGRNISFTGDCHIVSRKRVAIGNDCMISWGTLVMDTDSHRIYQDGIQINPDQDIVIGNDVWIGANCTLLKGTMIPEGCIVAAGSVISKKIEQERSIISGSPLRILRTGVSWFM